jgi:hypothetical protein
MVAVPISKSAFSDTGLGTYVSVDRNDLKVYVGTGGWLNAEPTVWCFKPVQG